MTRKDNAHFSHEFLRMLLLVNGGGGQTPSDAPIMEIGSRRDSSKSTVFVVCPSPIVSERIVSGNCSHRVCYVCYLASFTVVVLASLSVFYLAFFRRQGAQRWSSDNDVQAAYH